MTPQTTREVLKQAEEILDKIKGKTKFKFKDLSLSGFNKSVNKEKHKDKNIGGA